MRVAFTGIETIEADGRPTATTTLDPERLRGCVGRVLEGTALCAWATVTDAGDAHINTAYFAYSDDLELCFLSHPDSVHCRNVRTNPSMAVAVFASSQKWTEPGRGLQLFGQCSQAHGEEVGRAERVYGRRFPAFEAWRARLTVGDPSRQYQLFWFRTERLKLLDEAELGDAVWVAADITGRR